jgi:hypothetical protein
MTLRLHGEHTGTKERRHDARLAVARPVRVECPQTGRRFSGRTRDVSASGAMLEVDHPCLLVPGQPLRLGIAWTARQTVLRREDLLDAVVVRSLGKGPMQTVAISFTRRIQLAAAV